MRARGPGSPTWRRTCWAQTRCQPRRLVRRMDSAMRGQPYVKSALDMACWDAAARLRGQPLCEALGGRFGGGGRPLPLDSAGPRRRGRAGRPLCRGRLPPLQVKVGGDPHTDARRLAAIRDAVGPEVVLFADANGGWTTADARRFLLATSGHTYTLEQPCATLDECAAVRPHCAHPLILDESIDTLPALIRAGREGIADGVTIKIARVGGVTRAATLRDVAVELGMTVTVEDTGGATIDTAAMLHLSLSTPEPHRLHTVDFTDWVTVANGDGLPPTPPAGWRRRRRPASASRCAKGSWASRSSGRRDRAAPARCEPRARGRRRRRAAAPAGAAGGRRPGADRRGTRRHRQPARPGRARLRPDHRRRRAQARIGRRRRAGRVQPPDAALPPHGHRPRRCRARGAGGDAGAGGRVRARPLGRARRAGRPPDRRPERRARAPHAHDRFAGPVRPGAAGRPRGRAHR